MAKRIAELFVEVLAAAGVERIYGVAGDSLNGITDSVRRRNGIEWVGVRHEETAAFAAGAEAALTGKLAVCAGSCGPGNLHLINGLYDAHRSRVPVLAIAAQIPSQEIGSGYFQETHPEHLFKECSHYCELVSSSAQMPRTLEIAVQTALSKRGVAVVVLPGDIALLNAENDDRRVNFTFAQPHIVPRPEELDQLALELNRATRVTILAGAGCAGAHDELIQLAAKLQAPIVHAMRGKEFVEYDIRDSKRLARSRLSLEYVRHGWPCQCLLENDPANGSHHLSRLWIDPGAIWPRNGSRADGVSLRKASHIRLLKIGIVGEYRRALCRQPRRYRMERFGRPAEADHHPV